jgi:hypothetical protein
MSSSEESKAPESLLTPLHPDDTKNFKELQISKSGLSSLQIDAKDSSHAQYFVETSLYTPSKKDITLHAGHDSRGKILGDVDLKNFGGHYTIELGDPNVSAVILEELDRVKGWSSRHKFSFTYGSRQRQTFVWRHRGANLAENRDDLELAIEDDEREEEDEILAQYEKSGGAHGWKSKGRLLARGGGGEQWELMVILTLAALIVSKRREQ